MSAGKAKRYSVAVRAMFYKGTRGFYVFERGCEGFPSSVFAKTREGASIIKAAMRENRRAEAIRDSFRGPTLGEGLARRQAQEQCHEAQRVISSILLSGY